MSSEKQFARTLMAMLIANGYEAYIVGGAVRVMIHNKVHNSDLPIKDYDLVTNAKYHEIEQVILSDKTAQALGLTVDNRGAHFNVAIVQDPLENIEIEIASYRGESYPEGGSTRPDDVYYVDNFREDAKRRDFRFNAMAMDLKGNIIDYFDGTYDIEDRIVRCVGNPEDRFKEDPLRMLRAVRFCAQLGYSLDNDTLMAIRGNKHLLYKIPHTRIADEINKIINSKYPGTGFGEMNSAYLLGNNVKFLNTLSNTECELFPGFFSPMVSSFSSVVNKGDLINKWAEGLALYEADKARELLFNLMPLDTKDINMVYVMLLLRELGIPELRGFETTFDKNHPWGTLVLSIAEKAKSREVLKEAFERVTQISRTLNFEHVLDILMRPLYPKELPLDGNELCEIANAKPGPWIGKVQRALLQWIVFQDEYNGWDLPESLVKRFIEEAINE